MLNETFFPEIITKLPPADIPFQGLNSYIFQSFNQQIIFMSFEKDVDISEHYHEAQWGAVLDGEIELTIDGIKYIYNKGDTYFIPNNIPHSAKIKAGYKDITLFNQKDRFKVK